MSNAPRIGISNPSTSVRRLDMSLEATSFASDVNPGTANVLNGAIAHSVTFTTTPQDVSVAHRLGRKPRGWLITRQFAAPAGIVEVSSDDRFLVLRNLGAPAYSAELLVY